MSHALFFLTDTNPNDTTGGGGCLCSEAHDPDTKGPFVVIPSNDMESCISPHVVVCASCYTRLKDLFESGEVLSSGERGQVTELPPNAQPVVESNRMFVSPEVDFDEEHKPQPRRPRKPRRD